MLGGRGIFFSRSFILMAVLAIFVILPTILFKMGFEDNAFVAFFVEPFAAFAIIVFIGMAATYQLLRPHWVSLVHISAVLIIGFIYVWALLM